MTQVDAQTLYREVVLKHAREPHNRRRRDDASVCVTGDNPLCGDRLDVFVTFEDDVVADVSFEGSACAIVIAAASMMSEMLSGVPRAEAEARIDEVIAMLHDAASEPVPTTLNDTPIAALATVRQYPSRVKCAALPWSASATALADNGTDRSEPITTE